MKELFIHAQDVKIICRFQILYWYIIQIVNGRVNKLRVNKLRVNKLRVNKLRVNKLMNHLLGLHD